MGIAGEPSSAVNVLLLLIQLAINGMVALASISLVVVTLIYTIATRKMAGVMKRQAELMQKDFELRIAPLIEPRVQVRISGVMDPEITISVANKGFYPVRFDHAYYRWWHSMKPDVAQADLLQVFRWLEKGEQRDYSIKFDFSKVADIHDASDVKKYGIGTIELHFTDLSQNQFTLLKNKVIIFSQV